MAVDVNGRRRCRYGPDEDFEARCKVVADSAGSIAGVWINRYGACSVALLPGHALRVSLPGTCWPLRVTPTCCADVGVCLSGTGLSTARAFSEFTLFFATGYLSDNKLASIKRVLAAAAAARL